MKTMKKLLTLMLSAVLMAFVGIPAFAAGNDGYGTTAEPLSFKEDGSFKILHLTDVHMHDEQDSTQDMSEVLIKRMVEQQNPDLVIITGDIAMNSTLERTKENIDKLMTIFDNAGVKVAVNFGNHDSEGGLISREDLLRIYMQYDCSIAVDDGDILPGAGTYNIPILSSDGTKTAFNLWMIDSGEYDEEHRYASTDPAITSWYQERSNALKAANGGEAVNSLMFQHMIVPEIYDALEKSSRLNLTAVERIYHKGEFYVANPDNMNAGRLREYPCPGYYNNGQFDAILEQGDVLAMFFGHDHTNTFNIDYKGVDLVATPKAQFGDISDCIKGGRVIILNENDTSKYETKVVTFDELYDCGAAFKIEGNDDAARLERKTAATVNFYSSVYRTFDLILTKLLEIFTGKQLDFG